MNVEDDVDGEDVVGVLDDVKEVGGDVDVVEVVVDHQMHQLE